MTAIALAILAKIRPFVLAAGGVATAIFMRGRAAKARMERDQAKASLDARKRIDEASAAAPTDPDAARAKLRDRLRK